ncbi:hypothetical protein EYF80_030220 [Liparis tanakae]|uniref:Uncharacterized protein n=1 Tax=Liparis tanakae TaxID=230148 RepID=A0A4Z2H282_9TELE|nr:hypothetical protein EYF80_030220 [Liparis tanakae]
MEEAAAWESVGKQSRRLAFERCFTNGLKPPPGSSELEILLVHSREDDISGMPGRNSFKCDTNIHLDPMTN